MEHPGGIYGKGGPDRQLLRQWPAHCRGTFQWTDITDGELGWSGVGQGQDLVNPCALMVYMGAIANGGKAAEPYLIEKTVSPLGLPSLPHITRKPEASLRLHSPDTGRHDVRKCGETYGTSRFPNMELCAKSGTAEVGEDRHLTPGSPDFCEMRILPMPLW